MCESGSDGITTWAQLRGAGRSRRWLADALRSGELIRVRRGTYATAGACQPVVTAARHGGCLGCIGAARHLGLWVLDDTDEVHVWMGHGGHAYPHDGEECECVVHWDHVPQAGKARLSVAGVLRQILVCRGAEHFVVALESALHQNLLTPAGLAWLRSSTDATAREALDFATGEAESGLETLLRWRLRGRGIPIRAQVTIISVGRVDFLLGDRLIVEVDGRDNHAGVDNRHKDLVRDANAAIWGYVTLRFDYAMIVHDWDTVERAVLAQIDLGRHVR